MLRISDVRKARGYKALLLWEQRIVQDLMEQRDATVAETKKLTREIQTLLERGKQREKRGA